MKQLQLKPGADIIAAASRASSERRVCYCEDIFVLFIFSLLSVGSYWYSF
jgi:hypothetical protein